MTKMCQIVNNTALITTIDHGPLTTYAELRVTHAPGMPGTFSPQPWVSDPDMHHGTCVTHVTWCMSGSLTSGFLWSQWRGKLSQHSRCMRNSQFCVSGKRSIHIGCLSLRPHKNVCVKTSVGLEPCDLSTIAGIILHESDSSQLNHSFVCRKTLWSW